MILPLLILAVAFLYHDAVVADKRLVELISLVDNSKNVYTFTSINNYKNLVTKGDRDYDLFVFLTASKNVGCAVCQDWEDAFVEVAQAYKSQLNGRPERIFFTMGKFDTVPDIFRLYNLNHAPLILYIPHDLQDADKMYSKLTMNLANMEAAFPDPIAQFVTQRSGHKVEIIYSQWPKIVGLGSFLLFSLVAGRKVALILVPIFRRFKWFWFLFSIFLYGLGVSGSIYSYLRNVPNHGYNSKTKAIQYF